MADIIINIAVLCIIIPIYRIIKFLVTSRKVYMCSMDKITDLILYRNIGLDLTDVIVAYGDRTQIRAKNSGELNKALSKDDIRTIYFAYYDRNETDETDLLANKDLKKAVYMHIQVDVDSTNEQIDENITNAKLAIVTGAYKHRRAILKELELGLKDLYKPKKL